MESITDKKRLRVLSIDGGGIKGLIPLYFCDLLEKVTGQKIWELFDFFAGTSVGGMISLIFSQRLYSATDLLVKMLGILKNKIFPSKRYFQFILCGNSFYDSSLIEEVLQEIFGQVSFKNSMGNFLITGSEMNGEVCDPCMFVNYLGKAEYLKVNFKREEQDFFNYDNSEKIPEDLKIWEIARITSAAYPYFSKYTKIKGFEFLDGGFTYTNPSYLTIKYLEERVKIPLENIFMLSLACNEDIPRLSLNLSYMDKNILNLGSELLSNLKGLDDNMNNSVYNTVLLADALLKKRHIRIAPIGMEFITLDCVDNESINKLQNTARRMVKQYRNLTAKISQELGLTDINSIIEFNKKSKFYVIPRYFRYREFYSNLDQFYKNSHKNNELTSLLNNFDFPKDVRVTQKIIKLPKPSKLNKIFCCSADDSDSTAALAMSIGHLPTLRLIKGEIGDPFKFLQYKKWTLFHTAAANSELGGIFILIEDEYLEPNTLNSFGESNFNLEFKKDITSEKLEKLVNIFQTHLGVKYDLETAKNKETPIGLAFKYSCFDVINFHKRCMKVLEEKLKK